MSRFSKFDRSCLPDALEYYQKHFRKLSGHGEWRMVLCQFHDDHNPSLSINIDNGGFNCFACGTSGGDILDFHILLHGVDFKTAAKSLG